MVNAAPWWSATTVLLRSSPVQLLGWTLLHFLWQGALVGIAALLALRRQRSASSRFRHRITFLALLLLFSIPLLTGIRGLLPDLASPRTSVHSMDGTEAAAPTASSSTAFHLTTLKTVVGNPPSVRAWFVLFWVVGAAAGGALWLSHARAIRSLRREAREPSLPWRRASERASAALGLDVPPRLLESSRITAPLVAGVLRPLILVPPPEATALSDEDRTRILAHEIAHVLRRDPWTNLLQAWAEILLFFQPAVWIVSRVLRREREHCCDDLAAGILGDRIAYARSLAALAESRPMPRGFSLGGGSLLKERITRITQSKGEPAMHSRSIGRVAAGAAVLLLAATCLLPGSFAAGDLPPESVLARLQKAYAERDFELVRSCYTDDFTYYYGPQNHWGLSEELQSTNHMFHDPQVRDIRLEIETGPVVPGTEPDTWVINEIEVKLTIRSVVNGVEKTQDVLSRHNRFTVRLVRDPEPRIAICEWYSPAEQDTGD